MDQQLEGGGTITCSAPVVGTPRRLPWPGGGAALVSLANAHGVEFSMSIPRHACLFNFAGESHDHELTIDGQRVSHGKTNGSRINFCPAGQKYVGWGVRYRIEYLFTFMDPATLLASVGDALPAATTLRPAVGFNDSALWHLAHALRAECEHDGVTGPLYAETLGLALSMRLLQYQSGLGQAPARGRGGLAPWRLRRIIDYLGDNIAGSVALSDLAAIAELSPSHMARAFRTETGESPHRYHLRLRIERAKAMLSDSNLPLAEIALACGFPGQSHFTTMFRRATGITPGRFRERARI